SDTVTVDATGYTVTLIDNGQPLVILSAADFGLTGYESVAELDENSELQHRLEQVRLAAGHLMGLGDVAEAAYPKMTLVAPAVNGGAIATRSFIPHRVHESIGVLAAVTVATAVDTKGTVAAAIGTSAKGQQRTVGIAHPSGTYEALVALDASGAVVAAGNTRTARLISRGEVYVPKRIWDPIQSEKRTPSDYLYPRALYDGAGTTGCLATTTTCSFRWRTGP